MLRSRKAIFFFLFFLSGFSGLIYQSIWSHYLKLFLGHAAYAQTLVLAIFMGGLAVGSLVSGLLTQRWKSLLIGYAIVEGIVGLLAILFHGIFISVTDYTFTSLLSGMGDTTTKVVLLKWGVASLLIFPQSVLLGMTFPFMVGGILRHFPERPGYTLSMLYFTNSFGAVFGVLASSFVLITRFGLPGTMLTAGILNILLALIVWSLVKNHPEPIPKSTEVSNASNETTPVLPSILLLIALLTGLSSFMYEIGWIRMLVLVLGGSTHSFELMLASFILGLALGGLWIRNRIDKIENSRLFLGYVQIAMALAAVLSVWMYHYSFDLMSYVQNTIQKNNSTYPTFLFFSGLISVVIMLPTTFCAGMTLPLITRLIIRTNQREKGIGYVYSANTLGAIVGIFLSVHVVLPYLGLKNLIGIGAGIDLILGLYLIGFTPAKYFDPSSLRKTIVSCFCGLFVLSFFVVQFDVGRMTSGVYRYGKTSSATDVIYHADGKTSSVTVVERGSTRIIKNNGKPDASLKMDLNEQRTNDEDTQILLSAIPLFHLPKAKTAAIIGMGSGMSTHTMLGSPEMVLVDTIEMEAKVFEGSRNFLPLVDRAYNDPRSHLHVEDAKTFFSTHNKVYDIVVSEPPNPWVSGVSTLFSQEFYQRVKKHISTDGLFVQWVQLYEIDIGLVSTIFNALDEEFKDYVVYRAGKGNIVIVASPDKSVPESKPDALKYADLKPLLNRIKVETFQDIAWNRIASKDLLAPLFQKISSGINSDYFPILDSGASRARFTGVTATQFTQLITSSVPVLKILDGKQEFDSSQYTANLQIESPREMNKLLRMRDEILGTTEPYTGSDSELIQMSNSAHMLSYTMSNCGVHSTDSALSYLFEFGVRISTLLNQQEQQPLWDYFAKSACVTGPHRNESIASWNSLFNAINQRDYIRMSEASTNLLESGNYKNNIVSLNYVMSVGLMGDIMQANLQAANTRWSQWGSAFTAEEQIHLPLTLILANMGTDVQLAESEIEE